MQTPKPCHPLLALLSYSLLLIVSIVFLVIAVEYDPEGAAAKYPEHALEGHFTLEQGIPYLQTEEHSYPLHRTTPDDFDQGDFLIAYRTQNGGAIPERALPHKPRTTAALLTTIGIMLLLMLGVRGDPSVAFYDFLHKHA